MSDDTDVNLRRLIDLTAELPSTKPRKAAAHHPLGLDLGGRVTYAHPDGRVPLPTYPEGLENIRQAAEASVLNFPPEVSSALWSQVLGRPAIQAPLRPLSVEGLLAMNIPACEDNLRLFRQVGLAAVVEPVGLDDVHGRVAGTAIVTVQLSSRNRNSADDAWMQPSWTATTRALVFQLENFYRLGAPLPRALKSAVVLLSPELDRPITRAEGNEVKQIGHVFGYESVIVDRRSVTPGDVRQRITRRTPSLVVALGPADPEVTALRGLYTTAAVGGSFVVVSPANAIEAIQQLREHLATLAGITPGLTLLHQERNVLTDAMLPFPFDEASECLHDDFKRAYVLDGATGLWWTRDTAGHGKVPFKTYRRTSGKLVHDSDRNENGDPIAAKWKGPDGKIIAIAELHGCGNPGGHLSSPDR